MSKQISNLLRMKKLTDLEDRVNLKHEGGDHKRL